MFEGTNLIANRRRDNLQSQTTEPEVRTSSNSWKA
jgi:hypothetical protein